MDYVSLEKLEQIAAAPEARQDTVAYLTRKLRVFLKPQDPVLICFDTSGENSLGRLLRQAVIAAQGMPLAWEPDLRWRTLLRQAFVSRAIAILGPPLVVLGLTKLARATGTPLNIRNVLLAGYPCQDWMIDAIQRELDCRIWGCFGPGAGAVVSGFSCGCSRGIHLREDAYRVEIRDDRGNILPEGEWGQIVLAPARLPALCFCTGDVARMERTKCPCGQTSPRLMDISFGTDIDPALLELNAKLHSWTSILDCRLQMGPGGLEIELVTFPGEKLPKLPSCAKMVVRPWNPEKDVPFTVESVWKNAGYPSETH